MSVRRVREVFEEEQPRLITLPADEFPADPRIEVEIGKTPYARFDSTTTPHWFTQRTLTVVASLDAVRILDGQNVLATHTRSWDRAQQIEDPHHVESLEQFKRKGREHRTFSGALTVIHSPALVLGLTNRRVAAAGPASRRAGSPKPWPRRLGAP